MNSVDYHRWSATNGARAGGWSSSLLELWVRRSETLLCVKMSGEGDGRVWECVCLLFGDRRRRRIGRQSTLWPLWPPTVVCEQGTHASCFAGLRSCTGWLSMAILVTQPDFVCALL